MKKKPNTLKSLFAGGGLFVAVLLLLSGSSGVNLPLLEPTAAVTGLSRSPQESAAPNPRLKGSYRFEQGGWIYVHLEGLPSQLGFQHGYLLATEIADAYRAIRLDSTHRTKRDWDFFRATARDVLWPGIDAEYREELTAIAEGAMSHGAALDVWDIVAVNAFEEVPDYYVPWLNTQQKVAGAPRLASPGKCSAFVATGSYTRNQKSPAPLDW